MSSVSAGRHTGGFHNEHTDTSYKESLVSLESYYLGQLPVIKKRQLQKGYDR